MIQVIFLILFLYSSITLIKTGIVGIREKKINKIVSGKTKEIFTALGRRIGARGIYAQIIGFVYVVLGIIFMLFSLFITYIMIVR